MEKAKSTSAVRVLDLYNAAFADEAKFDEKPKVCELCKREKPAARVSISDSVNFEKHKLEGQAWLCRKCVKNSRSEFERSGSLDLNHLSLMRGRSTDGNPAVSLTKGNGGGLLSSQSSRTVSRQRFYTGTSVSDRTGAPLTKPIYYAPEMYTTVLVTSSTTAKELIDTVRKKVKYTEPNPCCLQISRDGDSTRRLTLDTNDGRPLLQQFPPHLLRNESMFFVLDDSGSWLQDLEAVKSIKDPETLDGALRSRGLRWVLGHHTFYDQFLDRAKSNYETENPVFWKAVEAFRKLQTVAERQTTAMDIWFQHLVKGAPEEVNVPQKLKLAVKAELDEALDNDKDVPATVFDTTQREVFILMRGNLRLDNLDQATSTTGSTGGAVSPRSATVSPRAQQIVSPRQAAAAASNSGESSPRLGKSKSKSSGIGSFFKK